MFNPFLVGTENAINITARGPAENTPLDALNATTLLTMFESAMSITDAKAFNGHSNGSDPDVAIESTNAYFALMSLIMGTPVTPLSWMQTFWLRKQMPSLRVLLSRLRRSTFSNPPTRVSLDRSSTPRTAST
jgi:hypothetical protein